MSEVDIFKENYFMNRVLWIWGMKGSRKVRVAYQLLKSCGVTEQDVLHLSAEQFIEMCEKPSLRPHLFLRSVLLIKIETLLEGQSLQLKNSIFSVQSERFRLGMRLLLISNQDLPSLEVRNPFVLKIPGCEENPSDFNERLHFFLEQASRVVQKRIDRVSESVALFFERISLEMEDDDLLDLLIVGVMRSEGGVLRLTDLFRTSTPKHSEIASL